MRLRILLPSRVLVDTAVRAISAEAENGAFGMLPRHIDFATSLAPGVLAYVDDQGDEHFVGIDRGILVKQEDRVLVCTGSAVVQGDLSTLRKEVQRRFVELDQHERVARTALARLEAGVVRRFIELED